MSAGYASRSDYEKPKKLKVTRCSVDRATGETSPLSGASNVFEVTINPKAFNRSYSISYNSDSNAKKRDDGKTVGGTSVESSFSTMGAEDVSFALVLDGTGVVPQKDPANDVKAQLDGLKNIVYRYQGKVHEPSVVELSWGVLDDGIERFVGRMKQMKVAYTLFAASGTPLRASVDLAFVSYRTRIESAKRANLSSPDMSHLVRVRAGDTLPALCHRIYKDSSHYLTVARANGLSNFRALEPGQTLYFPPIDSQSPG